MLIATYGSSLRFDIAFLVLPDSMRQVDVSDPGKVAFWSGQIGAIAGLLSAGTAPI